MARRYFDIIHPENAEPEDARTGEEIVEDVLSRIGACPCGGDKRESI